MSTLTRLMAPCLFLTALAAYGQSENLQLAQELANDASVEYPYNPDADASGQVGAEDLIELFIYFGNPLGFQISDDDMSLPSIASSWRSCLSRNKNKSLRWRNSFRAKNRPLRALHRC